MTRILTLTLAAAVFSLASCAGMKKECSSCCASKAEKKECCEKAKADGKKCDVCKH